MPTKPTKRPYPWATKDGFMKKLFWRALFFLIPFLYSVYVSSHPQKHPDCSTNCFSSEVVEITTISASCTTYELKVSFEGDCAHALSHYSVAVPCGEIKDIWNSENWKQVIGTDPTTGIAGFKIDDISDFGERGTSSFRVRFTVCSTTADCDKGLKCWQPTVAYKASTCVNYETLSIACKSLKASLQGQDVSCFGGADGSLGVVVEDGQEPFSFQWSTQSTGQTVSGLTAGEYSVIVRDASGAEVILQENIQEPEAIAVLESVSSPTCSGIANGSIALEISGGVGPYKVSWNDGQEGETLIGLSAGLYIATVTDSKGCTITKGFNVLNASTLSATALHMKPDCNMQNGSIDLSISGGSGPYSFQWSNGETSEDLTNLGSGLYSVTVTDAAGCSTQKAVLLRENNTLTITGTTNPAACSGDPTGSIDATVSGGTPPYTYQWSSGEITQDITALPAGSYTLKVQDSKGCTATANFSVPTTTFHIARTLVQPTCYGASNGSITLHEPIGGTSPYTYQWSTGDTGTSLTDLAAGSYSVTVSDAAGCTKTYSFKITDPQELSSSASVSSSACNEEGSYQIDLSITGGSEPYTYQWSNGVTTQDLSNAASGSYTVVITDANGCTTSREVVVEHSDAVLTCTILEPLSSPSCNSSNNTLSASEQDADSYSWEVTSSDAGWAITSGSGPSITYTAGSASSSAAFTLTMTKGGCTTSCTYTVAACTVIGDGETEEPGGEEPGGEEPEGEIPGDKDETCEDCFETVAELISVSGGCRTYEMKVSTNGLCRHDLSHWTVSIPCGTVTDYSNSNGWQMELGLDPTTGVYGLKVDDIPSFGKQPEVFTVRFTICESGSCDVTAWNPSVAYKAGQCVSLQSVRVENPVSVGSAVAVYPNPFAESLYIRWPLTQQYFLLDIIDQYGNVVIHSRADAGSEPVNSITLDASTLPKGIYFYRLKIDGMIYSGKLTKQ